MIELKFKNPTAILPARGDKLVLELCNDNWEVSGHVECDRITVLCNGDITAELYDEVKHTIDIRSMVYPNKDEICIKSPEGEYIHLLVHKFNGTEWITEEFFSSESTSMNVRISNLKGKVTEFPTIKGFTGNIIYPLNIKNYRTQLGYISAGTNRISTNYGNFPGKNRTLGVYMNQYDRFENTENAEFGVSEICAVDKNDKFIIEPLGYECTMKVAYPINKGTKIVHDLKWFMNNP